MNIRPKTIICDIDGTLMFHSGKLSEQIQNEPKILPGVTEVFDAWDKKGYRIILLTGRKESMRELTERQLKLLGIFYDQLVMGVGGGDRILVNDLKPNSDKPTAIAVNLERNAGISNLLDI
jgi:phosphoglycolate phosphatase-like HAD superfamily hydrolase